MIYMFLADGFEEVEALTPLDFLRRAGAEVKTVGIGKKIICGTHGIKVEADVEVSSLDDFNAEMIILPGGMPGTANLAASREVRLAIETASANHAFIAAICAAPSILGEMGLLVGRDAVCFPGFEKSLKGADISNYSVIRDDNIITAAGMGVAVEFGLTLVSCLYGAEKAEELFYSTQAHRR